MTVACTDGDNRSQARLFTSNSELTSPTLSPVSVFGEIAPNIAISRACRDCGVDDAAIERSGHFRSAQRHRRSARSLDELGFIGRDHPDFLALEVLKRLQLLARPDHLLRKDVLADHDDAALGWRSASRRDALSGQHLVNLIDDAGYLAPDL
nr:hypothetical protein [Bradyrhizobium sp. WSM2793]